MIGNRGDSMRALNRISLLLLALAACATPVPIRFGAHGHRAPVVAVNNPDFADGDPIAGRHAFIDMQCIDCHRVAEDPRLPRGARAVAGPQLGHLSRYTPKGLAQRITSSSTGAGEALLDRGMKDYAQPITARKLVDVVAYLRNPRLPGD
jgi:hypothetical protein